MSRASARPQLLTIYWRDIPAQVSARSGRRRVSAKLEDRFQVAIDGAATRAGLTDNESYLAEWREERVECGDDLEEEVRRRIEELQAEFPPDRLREHVRSNGWSPERPVSESP